MFSSGTVAFLLSAAHIAYQVIQWVKAHKTQIAAIEQAAETMGPDIVALFNQMKSKAGVK